MTDLLAFHKQPRRNASSLVAIGAGDLLAPDSPLLITANSRFRVIGAFFLAHIPQWLFPAES